MCATATVLGAAAAISTPAASASTGTSHRVGGSLSRAARPRPVNVRIDWLAERLAHHQYVCRHGAHRNQWWNCQALRWTTRELHEAEHEQWVRDWSPPPEPYLSIARCEQRDDRGLYGVKWDAYSISYEGAYGFLHSTWRENRLPWMPASANRASIREQTIVAKRVQRRYGWSPWPACHVRLGLT